MSWFCAHWEWFIEVPILIIILPGGWKMYRFFCPVAFRVWGKNGSFASLIYSENGYFIIEVDVLVIERGTIDWQNYCEFSLIGQDKSFPLSNCIANPNIKILYKLEFMVWEYDDSKQLRDPNSEYWGKIKVKKKYRWIKSPSFRIRPILTTDEIKYDEWNEKMLRDIKNEL